MRSLAHSRSTRARLADELRERRLVECRRAVEEFVVGLALLMAGHEPELEHCATRGLIARIRAALIPLLSGDAMVRPDFGSHGELRVDGDLLDVGRPVAAWVEFENRSMRQVGDRRIASPRRRVRLHLLLSLQPCQVTDMDAFVADAM